MLTSPHTPGIEDGSTGSMRKAERERERGRGREGEGGREKGKEGRGGEGGREGV